MNRARWKHKQRPRMWGYRDSCNP